MTSSPCITILMSVYNARLFLDRAIDSILRQTFRDFEYLIIDDGSTDDSSIILNTYASRDARIRLFRNDRNMGLVASLNRGLHEARGELIARMDADDSSRPDRLARQVAFLERHPDIGICGGQILKHVGHRTHPGRYPLSPGECAVTLLFQHCFAHPTVMMRRAMLRQHGFLYDERFRQTEDYDLWSRMLDRVQGGNLPQVVLDYYCHSNQESGTNYPVVAQRRDQIRGRVVRKLIPDASPDDLALHYQIGFPQDPFDLDLLDRAERWLLRLVDANRSIHRYDEPAMRRVFAYQWLAICGQAAHLGLPAFRRFWKSPLRDSGSFPLKSAKLLAKCAIRKTTG